MKDRIIEIVSGESGREIQLFRNDELGVQMRTILNSDGSISVNLEDAAKGLGFTRTANSGNEVVRWERVQQYLKEFGACPQMGTEDLGFNNEFTKDDYIPESLYYLLAMKASNRKAQKFQKWLALDVIPKIRRSGSYNMEPETVEQTVTVTETRPYENPHTILEASKIMSGCLEGNRPYVLNILRHIVPDIDDLPEKETVTEVNAEVKVKPKKDRPNYWKQGVPIDVDKMLFTAAEQGITIEQLAEKAAVTVNTMTNWITKKHKPVLQNRINVCMALGKDENFLTPRRERRRP